MNRHMRQQDIPNWNQEKIANTKALILGADILGQMTLGCLTGLGIGHLVIMDNLRTTKQDQNFLFPLFLYAGMKKIEKIEETAKAIDNTLDIRGIHSKLSLGILNYIGFEPDIVIDTQNDKNYKISSLDYAAERKKIYLSAYCNHRKAIVSLANQEIGYDKRIIQDEQILDADPLQGSITAGICAGIIADETRKSLFKLNQIDNSLESRITFNLESPNRIGLESKYSLEIKERWKQQVLVAGAGAIGNYVALNLALAGFKYIDIVDNDHIEDHNLARQILFYGKIGEPKATVLAARLRQFSNVESKGYVEKITPKSLEGYKKNGYGLVFGCFDNEEARYHLNEFTIKSGIPYIDGGTSSDMGGVAVYAPGKTKCITCRKSLKPNPTKATCMQAAPSVVTPNIIIGSAMVGEALNLLNNRELDNILTFDSNSSRRLYLSSGGPQSENCPCRRVKNGI